MFSSKIDLQRLETLIEINTLINSNYSQLNTLLTRILESATRLTHGEASSLLLLNHENNKLYFEIAIGPKSKDVQKFSLNLGEGIAGWVAQHNTSLIVNDVDDDKRFFGDIDSQVGFTTSSILAVPMRVKDSCVGVIEIINRVDGKVFNNEDLQWLEIFATQAAIALQNAKSYLKIKEEVFHLQDKIESDKGYHQFIYKSPVIKKQLEILQRVAATESSVLILGESGVGKELFAEQIHLNSGRSSKPFIRVNCAALPEHLLESELFGHVKGAFTDASTDRIGRFELADTGTIFLDEIGDMPLNLQSKLLRVLQQKVFEKVGASEPVSVDVRIIAATNKNLEEAIEQGKFRQDLYYRLNVFPMEIPPLRERREDILEIAGHVLQKVNRTLNKKIQGFSDEAVDALLSYSWPGNVRELENVVERGVVIARDLYLSPADLMIHNAESTTNEVYRDKTLKDAINIFKKHFITSILEKSNWKQTTAAKQLGIQRTYLSKLIKELEIDK